MKSVHCSYCGRELFLVHERLKEHMHIQNMEILAVCEACDKPTKVTYNQHDFKDFNPVGHPEVEALERRKGEQHLSTVTQVTCSGCGGQMQQIGGEWHCRACEAMEQ